MTPQVWAGAIATVCQPLVLLYLAIGVLLGICIGALPGLSATMGIALLTPIYGAVAFGVLYLLHNLF